MKQYRINVAVDKHKKIPRTEFVIFKREKNEDVSKHIVGYDKLNKEDKLYGSQLLQEYFTLSEVIEVTKYFHESSVVRFLNISPQTFPLDISDFLKLREERNESTPMNCNFYEDKDYNLGFDIAGFCLV